MSHRNQFNFDFCPPIPDNVGDVLAEFTIACMLEKPENVIDYAVDYFTKYQADRNVSVSQAELQLLHEELLSDDDESIDIQCQHLNRRRSSVFAESLDPEKFGPDEEVASSIFPKSDEQLTRLTQMIGNMFVFRSLDKDQLRAVLDAMFERTVKVNETIIREGEDGDYFYVIESGRFTAVVGNQTVATYNNRGSFGELSLMYNVPRAATVKADTDGRLWAMDRYTFRRILLTSAHRKRKIYEKLIDGVGIFKMLPKCDRCRLADAMHTITFSRNERIVKKGESLDGIYMIEDGIVSVREVRDGGVEQEISQLGKGKYFGELSLMTNPLRMNSIYAVTDTVKLAFLDAGAVGRLVGSCIEIMRRSDEAFNGLETVHCLNK